MEIWGHVIVGSRGKVPPEAMTFLFDSVSQNRPNYINDTHSSRLMLHNEYPRVYTLKELYISWLFYFLDI